jgi:hypothetical protein
LSFTLVSLACTTLAERSACAQETTTQAPKTSELTTGLVYQAPPECPKEDDFIEQVQRRSARVRFVSDGSALKQLSVVISASPDKVVGKLRLVEPDGTTRVRSLNAPTCREAVDGLALIATVSLDPEALASGPPEQPARPPESPPKPQVTKSAPKKKPDLTGQPKKMPREPPEPEWEYAVGAELSSLFASFPQPALGGSLFAGAAWQPKHWFSPLVRATFSYYRTSVSEQPQGDANFSLSVGTVSVCPLRVALAQVGELRPCLFSDTGGLVAWGTHTQAARQHTVLYAGVGASAQASLELGEVLEIIVEGGVGHPLVRDEFVFLPDSFFTTPLVYGKGSVGLAILLP